ncbi:GmrSD restriction endonuclease domain-containing protein [Gordonia terrae]
MTVEYSSKGLAQVVSEASAGQVLLPNFQRQFVWTADAHRQLAASVLINIPCGSLLLVKGESSDFSSRRVGHNQSEPDGQPSLPCEFLLDGQQRVSTLRALFSDPFAADWRSAYDQTFPQLRARWSVRLKPGSSDDRDLFGLNSLRFNGLPPEPDLVSEAIVQHPVFKTKNLDNWAHPAFEPKSGKAERQLHIGKAAAAVGLVPLWEVSANDNPAIAKHAIQDIAEYQRKELLAGIRDNTISLSDIDGFLETGEKPEDLDETTIDDRLRDRRAEWVQAILNLLKEVREFRVSTITLTSDELPKAIAIFEAINRGGTPLSAFDLVTARYARGQSGHSLPEQVQDLIATFDPRIPAALALNSVYKEWSAEDNVGLLDGALTNTFKTQFLQSMAMHSSEFKDGPRHTFTVDESKQQRVLSFSASDVDSVWEDSCRALLQAWRFLQVRCGVKDEGSLRNKLLVLPLAMVLPRIADTNTVALNRMEYWYWCSVLTDTYTNRQNENAIADTNLLLEWISDPSMPNPFAARAARVFNDDGYSSKQTLLRLSDEARVGTDVGLYLLQFVTARGGRDLLSNERLNVQLDALQDHHLIPLATATSIGQSSTEIRKGKTKLAEILNSPLNRAYVLKSTNQTIGPKSLQNYIRVIEPATKASLYLTIDENYIQEGTDFEAYATGALSDRFDLIKSAAVNHISSLVQ